MFYNDPIISKIWRVYSAETLKSDFCHKLYQWHNLQYKITSRDLLVKNYISGLGNTFFK